MWGPTLSRMHQLTLAHTCNPQRFGDYRPDDPSSFILRPEISFYPQFMFNLRRCVRACVHVRSVLLLYLRVHRLLQASRLLPLGLSPPNPLSSPPLAVQLLCVYIQAVLRGGGHLRWWPCLV